MNAALPTSMTLNHKSTYAAAKKQSITRAFVRSSEGCLCIAMISMTGYAGIVNINAISTGIKIAFMVGDTLTLFGDVISTTRTRFQTMNNHRKTVWGQVRPAWPRKPNKLRHPDRIITMPPDANSMSASLIVTKWLSLLLIYSRLV